MDSQFIYSDLIPVGLWNGIEEKIRQLYEIIMYSSLFVAFAAAGMIYTSYGIEGGIPTPAGILIMFLVAFSVYNLNRKTDEAEDAVNHVGRFAFTKKYERILFILAICCYSVAVAIASLFGPMSVLVAFIPIIAGSLYSIPWLPIGLRYRRLKEIPLVKNLVVASAWALTLSFLPVSTSASVDGTKVLISFVFFASYVFIASTIPDIRDREGDALAGIKTIPVILGVERTKAILTMINLTAGGLAVVISSMTLPLVYTIILASGICYIHLCIHSFYQVKDRDMVCDILADGQFILFGGIIWVLGIFSG